MEEGAVDKSTGAASPSLAFTELAYRTDESKTGTLKSAIGAQVSTHPSTDSAKTKSVDGKEHLRRQRERNNDAREQWGGNRQNL